MMMEEVHKYPPLDNEGNVVDGSVDDYDFDWGDEVLYREKELPPHEGQWPYGCCWECECPEPEPCPCPCPEPEPCPCPDPDPCPCPCPEPCPDPDPCPCPCPEPCPDPDPCPCPCPEPCPEPDPCGCPEWGLGLGGRKKNDEDYEIKDI